MGPWTIKDLILVTEYLFLSENGVFIAKCKIGSKKHMLHTYISFQKPLFYHLQSPLVYKHKQNHLYYLLFLCENLDLWRKMKKKLVIFLIMDRCIKPRPNIWFHHCTAVYRFSSPIYNCYISLAELLILYRLTKTNTHFLGHQSKPFT